MRRRDPSDILPVRSDGTPLWLGLILGVEEQVRYPLPGNYGSCLKNNLKGFSYRVLGAKWCLLVWLRSLRCHGSERNERSKSQTKPEDGTNTSRPGEVTSKVSGTGTELRHRLRSVGPDWTTGKEDGRSRVVGVLTDGRQRGRRGPVGRGCDLEGSTQTTESWKGWSSLTVSRNPWGDRDSPDWHLVTLGTMGYRKLSKSSREKNGLKETDQRFQDALDRMERVKGSREMWSMEREGPRRGRGFGWGWTPETCSKRRTAVEGEEKEFQGCWLLRSVKSNAG